VKTDIASLFKVDIQINLVQREADIPSTQHSEHLIFVYTPLSVNSFMGIERTFEAAKGPREPNAYFLAHGPDEERTKIWWRKFVDSVNTRLSTKSVEVSTEDVTAFVVQKLVEWVQAKTCSTISQEPFVKERRVLKGLSLRTPRSMGKLDQKMNGAPDSPADKTNRSPQTPQTAIRITSPNSLLEEPSEEEPFRDASRFVPNAQSR
jgi:hypothetical protein